MLTDDQAEKAADFIKSNAGKFAQAKATRIYCEEYRKSLKAILFNQMEGTIADKENKAYAHEKYLLHLDELRNAVIEEEKLRGLIKAAEMQIEIWRSESANSRGRI